MSKKIQPTDPVATQEFHETIGEMDATTTSKKSKKDKKATNHRKSTHKGSIAKKAANRLMIGMVTINFIALCVIGTYTKVVVHELEENRLANTASTVSTAINASMDQYISIAEVISKNSNVVTLLAESNKLNQMQHHELAPTVLSELQAISADNKDVFVDVYLLSVAQDSYFAKDSSTSDASFSFATRPYYAAVTSQKTVITDPYIDVDTGLKVISITSPVFSGNNVVGAVSLDLTTDFATKIISASDFCTTGTNFVVDPSGTIIAHNTPTNVGQNVSVLQLSGLTSELSTPSGTMVEFTQAGVDRTGRAYFVGDLGWTLVTSYDTTEYLLSGNLILRILAGML
ncbi:MAG: cache domain-containing protein, partial [Eubacteriales bacterium]